MIVSFSYSMSIKPFNLSFDVFGSELMASRRSFRDFSFYFDSEFEFI